MQSGFLLLYVLNITDLNFTFTVYYEISYESITRRGH